MLMMTPELFALADAFCDRCVSHIADEIEAEASGPAVSIGLLYLIEHTVMKLAEPEGFSPTGAVEMTVFLHRIIAQLAPVSTTVQ